MKPDGGSDGEQFLPLKLLFSPAELWPRYKLDESAGLIRDGQVRFRSNFGGTCITVGRWRRFLFCLTLFPAQQSSQTLVRFMELRFGTTGGATQKRGDFSADIPERHAKGKNRL